MSEVTLRVNVEGVEQVTEGFHRIGNEVGEMGRKVEDSTRKASMSMKDLVVGFSGVATSAFSLYAAYDRVADMQVSINRANLQVKSSLNSVEDAQRRYNATVEKYGSASEEANAAAKDLQLAQERYQVATERAEMMQGNLNEAIMQSALTVIPSLITMIANISADSDSWNKIKEASIILDAKQAAGAVAHAAAEGGRQVAIWATVVAEKARAIAHAIANALSGPWGWAILAGAAVAAGTGIALAASIPSKQYGGLIEKTQPYLLHREEYVESIEERRHVEEVLSRVRELPSPHTSITNIVTIEGPIFRSKGDMDYLVDRLKRMGMA